MWATSSPQIIEPPPLPASPELSILIDEVTEPITKVRDEATAELSNVLVVCRFRPFNHREGLLGTAESKDLFRISEDQVEFKDSQGSYQSFKMSKVFPPETTQEQVFRTVAQKAMTDLFSGYNASIFAYGQTGSGKSYTMFGSLKDINLRGLIPRCTETIFQTIKSGAVFGSTITISCSYCEIYQEVVTDLLKPEKGPLQLRESSELGVYVQNLTHEYVGSVVDVYALIALGDVSKRRASTKMNPHSSRSHCCFSIIIEQKNSLGKGSRAQLNLVDLAGSERISKTQAEGQSLEEAKKINLSLTALSQVINALADGSNHVPYRVSKLTRLLQNSLGGNSKTSMVVACSPHADNREETLSSLRFAARCSCVANKVKQNTLLSADELREMLERAHLEILRATGGQLPSRMIDAETQTDGNGEQDSLMDAVENVLNSDALNRQVDQLRAEILESHEQINVKQLEIDTLNQRLIQANRRLIDHRRISKDSKDAVFKSEKGPTTDAESTAEKFSFFKKKKSVESTSSFMSPRKLSLLISHNSRTLFGRKKSRRKSLSADNLSHPPPPREPRDFPEHPSGSGKQVSFKEIVVVDDGVPPPPESPTNILNDDYGSEFPVSRHSIPKIPVPRMTIDETDLPDNSGFDRSETIAESPMNTYSQSQRNDSLESVDFKVEQERLAVQCEKQDSIIERQQELIKKLKAQIDSYRLDEQDHLVTIESLELEVSTLREQMLRKDRLVGRQSMGGANLVVPIDEDSVLQPMRDQQDAGKLGQLFDLFSFGFGSAGNGEGGSNRISQAFQSLNFFSTEAEPTEEPKEKSGILKLKFW